MVNEEAVSAPSGTPDADYLKETVGDVLKAMILKVAVSARDDQDDPIDLLAKLLFAEADAMDARKARKATKDEEDEALATHLAGLAKAGEPEEAASTGPGPADTSEGAAYGPLSTAYPSTIAMFANYTAGEPAAPAPAPDPAAAAADEGTENVTMEGGTTAPVDGDAAAEPEPEKADSAGDAVFNAMDTNADGKVDAKEFDESFKKMDANDDGVLKKEEIAAAVDSAEQAAEVGESGAGEAAAAAAAQ